MATITWKNAVSGDFSVAADWTGGVVPGSSDDALLNASGGAYTVTISTNPTVNSLQLASNATAAIAASTSFDMLNGTGSGADAGQISVGNNSTVYIGGTFDNTSTVTGGGLVLNGVANTAELRLVSTTTKFTGAGSVVLGTGGNNLVLGNAGSADTLDNVSETFSGVGNIGAGNMTMINETAGVVNANQTGQLVLNVNGGVTNTGLLEATNTGGLFILNTGITNTAGVIKATGTGAHVDLQNSSVSGGTFTAGSGAQIDVVAGQSSYIYGAGLAGPVTITGGSTFNINNNATLYAAGSIVNSGLINLLGVANASELRFRTAISTLTGGGHIVMGGNGNNLILGDNGAANTLVNANNTISGIGNLGAGNLTFVNQAAGVVNADQTGALTLQVNGGVTNGGVMEASNTGGLFILNTGIDNAANNDGGKIEATTSGSHVDLQNSTISAGDLSAVAGAEIDVVSGQSATLDGTQPNAPVFITSGTNFSVNNNATVYIAGHIENGGVINLLGAANTAAMRLTTPITSFTGGGKIVLGTGGNNIIVGNGGALDELDNVNNTISGVGNIGAGDMTVLNEAAGVINANQTGQLTLQDNGGVENKGLLEATNTGGLFILNTSVDDTESPTTANIEAVGAGAHVDLQNSNIYGGSLTTSGTGAVIDVVSGQAAGLDGTYSAAPINITTGSTVLVNNNSTLYLRGVINNAGTIDLGVDGEPNGTDIRLNSATVTLQGGGVVQMSNSGNNYFTANDNSSETLDNVNNTIQGSGNIGNGSMTMINGTHGVIDADQAPGPGGSGEPGELVIQMNGGLTNTGLIEATVGSGQTQGGNLFILNTTVNATYSGATIQAVGNSTLASTVMLQNDTFNGGTFTTSGGPSGAPSQVEIVSGQAVTLNGQTVNVDNTGVFNVNNNSTLYLQGNITNTKQINLLGAANGTDISIASANVTLFGGGQIDMSDSANNYITSNNSYQDLYISTGTIQGSGDVGNGSNLKITNESGGVINANQTVQLIIQVSRTLENYGTIESNTTVTGAGGLLVLNSGIDNTIANPLGTLNTGKLTASGTGHIDLQNSTIYGGTLTASGTAYIDVVSGQSASLVGDQLAQPLNITSNTNFNVNNNSTVYLYGQINNNGHINLNSAANSSVISLNSPEVILTGIGTINLGGTNADDIVENQGNSELENSSECILGGGAIGNGGPMYLDNLVAGTIDASLASGISINLGGVATVNYGTLVATGGPLTIANGIYNLGRIIADGGNVKIAGNVDSAGTMLISGPSELEIGESVGGASNQTVQFVQNASLASGGTFKIDNAQDFTGSVSDLATGDTLDLANINDATATLSYSGNSSGGVLTLSDGTTTASITLVGDYNQTNFAVTNDGGGHTDVTYTGTPLTPTIVADTALKLSGTVLNTLQADSALTEILVTDSGYSNGLMLTINIAELTNDAGAIGKLVYANGTAYRLRVIDTAADLSGAALDEMQANGHVNSVAVSDDGAGNGGFVTTDVAQLTSDAAIFNLMVFANGQNTKILNVTDTAADISADLGALNSTAKVGKVTISDNAAITLTAAQLAGDTTLLGELANQNGNPYTLKVDDTAADLSGAELNALQANTHVAAIVVSDNGSSNGGFVTASVAQLTSDAGALSKLTFANSQAAGTVNVSDTAADISGDLAALNTDGQVGRITISDNNPITLTAAAYNADTTALGELHNANGSAVVFDIVDTSADLNGATFSNLITKNDAIDATDIAFAHITATFTENGAGTEGVLSLTDGTHSAAIKLFGQYAAAGFSGSATAAGFSVAVDHGTGTVVTLLSTVPA